MVLTTIALATALVLTTRTAMGQAQQQNPLAGYDLVAALRVVPGCLGVETARTASGKQVIFAWFENKQAVLRWYNTDTHQAVMHNVFPNVTPRGPLQGVPDDTGPILAIASLTPAEKPQFQQVAMPISQIAIELYRPVPGGLFLGSRFAPAGLKVEGMRDYTPQKKE